MNQIVPSKPDGQLPATRCQVPILFANAGEEAVNCFLEFFAATIRNPGTRAAYAHAVNRFAGWCTLHNVNLPQVNAVVVGTYIEFLTTQHSAPTVKLHLAAIRMLFRHLVSGQVIKFNHAASVRGPTHVIKKGKTPVLTGTEARHLIGAIDTSTIVGLRDRALIGVMVYSFARVSAALGMTIGDYYPQGRKMWFRLLEKGGKHHEVPAHHNAVEFLEAYLSSVNRADAKKLPLFCTVSRSGILTETQMHRTDALRMIKRRATRAGLPESTNCHTFRATGITVYLQNGGSLEHAQRIASHESARTTKLYDRTGDTVSLDEVEKILL